MQTSHAAMVKLSFALQYGSGRQGPAGPFQPCRSGFRPCQGGVPGGGHNVPPVRLVVAGQDMRRHPARSGFATDRAKFGIMPAGVRLRPAGESQSMADGRKA